MFELIAGVLLAAGGVYFVLLPVLRPDAAPEPDEGDAGRDPQDDLSPRAVALRALKEIEFDRATGKLSDADYLTLKAKYTAEALAALRDAGGEMRDAGNVSLRPSAHTASRISHPVCPVHGARPESNAEFCSECGRRLGTAPGFCIRCGGALETDARFCNRCGARVAA